MNIVSMGKSTSSDHDVWHGVHREQRRGSLPRGNLENQQSGKIHILCSFTEWLADVIFQPWGGGNSELLRIFESILEIEYKWLVGACSLYLHP